MIGTQLAERYRVLDEIGSGAMGVVYRALDEKLNCPVAIKVLKPAAPGDESLRKQALEEARHIAKLNHPNVVTVHDVESKQGRDFLVMEYVPGVTLDQMLSGGPLPETEVVELGTQLLEGLRAAHVQGLIHRDLKPGNLRVTPDGRLKILDFGLAKGLQSSSGVGDSGTLTASLVVKGTLPYMAPEQLLGKKVDQRVDIYAAGAVLYEMATGQRLYPEFSGGSLQHAILNNTPERPRAVNPEISARLEGVILKALEKRPEQRYPTAVALLSALKALRETPAPSPPRPLLR